MFNDATQVAEAIYYFISLDFSSVEEYFPTIKKESIIKESDKFKQKLEDLVKQLISFDKGIGSEEMVTSL